MKRFPVFILLALLLLVVLFAFGAAPGAGIVFALFVGATMEILRAPLSGTGGGTLKFTNTTGGDLASEAWVVVNERLGILLEACADGEEGMIVYQTDSQGAWLQKAAVAVAEGEDAYLIIATGLVTNDPAAAANPRVGFFAEAAASGTARVRTVLNAGLQDV